MSEMTFETIDPKSVVPVQQPQAPAPEQPASAPARQSMTDALSDFVSGKAPEKPADKPEETVKATAKPEDSLSKLGLDDPGVKKDKQEQKQPDAPQNEPGPKALRKEYEAKKAEAAQLRTELEALRSAKRPDVDAIQAKVKELTEANEKLSKKIAEVSYIDSDEYKSKWVEPRQKAFDAAYAEISELEITSEDGSVRKATSDDFNAILRAPTAQAYKMAQQFGPAASEVMAQRRDILKMVTAEREHLQAIDKEIGQRREQTEAQRAAESQRLASIFKTRMDSRIDVLSTSPIEGWKADEKDMDLGRQLSNLAFEGDESLKPDDIAAVRAEVAARAVAWKPMAKLVDHLQTEMAVLKQKLAKYESSNPKAGEPANSQAGGQRRTMEEELAAFIGAR